MTIGSILLGLALLLLVLLYLARPFLRKEETTATFTSSRQQLLAQKEALLTQISALDFDFETGKVPETLYQQQRAEMVAKAAIIFEQLAALPQDEAVDSEIEAAIAQLRTQLASPVSANGHGRTCPECGTAVDPNDKFCAHCGHKLANPALAVEKQ